MKPTYKTVYLIRVIQRCKTYAQLNGAWPWVKKQLEDLPQEMRREVAAAFMDHWPEK